jgi:NADH:ubiquinone oxidoreductase subunit H
LTDDVRFLLIFENEILAATIAAVSPLLFILTFVLFAVWLERKFLLMQDRLGPMRTSWHGWLQQLLIY